MAHIHIVNPYNSAAMQRMISPLMELSKLYEVDTSKEVDPAADINIHCPFHTLADDIDYGNGKHIAIYTHCNPGAEDMLITACERADIVTAMSFTGRQELLDYGVDPKKIWTIYNAADMFPYRKRAILIVGYPQPNGRKRESLLLDLAWKHDLTPYEIILAGEQWEETAAKLQSLGVAVKYTNADSPELIKQLYQYVDLFLATGYVEGGPLPLLEAMASGVPVLAPAVGYANDLLSLINIYDSVDDLFEKITEMFESTTYYHLIARAWSWQDYVAEYALLIGRMMGTSVDLYPERGASRYSQLLDIIDNLKPKRICEIGTWNGNRAIQMIQQVGKYHTMKRINYQGFDLFSTQTAEQFRRELSKRGHEVEVVYKRVKATGASVELIEGETLDTIHRLTPADFYFIDGGHSEETIENDGTAVLKVLEKGIAVFDDYYHEGKPEGMGCNKFIDELDPLKFEVIHLPARTQASDGRVVGMVQVKRANIRLQMPVRSYHTTYSSVN